MKKTLVMIFSALACCALLSGCGQKQAQTPLVVYSFCGENEILSLTNGIIVLSPAEEIFYGGTLDGELSDVVGYSMTFYLSSGGEDRVLLSNSVEDTTGQAISIAGEIGTRSGDILPAAEADMLEDNLYFELKTTQLNGEEHTYRLPLTLTPVTG